MKAASLGRGRLDLSLPGSYGNRFLGSVRTTSIYWPPHPTWQLMTLLRSFTLLCWCLKLVLNSWCEALPVCVHSCPHWRCGTTTGQRRHEESMCQTWVSNYVKESGLGNIFYDLSKQGRYWIWRQMRVSCIFDCVNEMDIPSISMIMIISYLLT